MTSFFAMGGYAIYVWPAYVIAMAVIIGMAARTFLTWRRWRDRVRALEKNGAAA